MISFVENLRQEFHLNIGVFGHCGDGNLHVNFMYDENNENETDRAVSALNLLMEKVIKRIYHFFYGNNSFLRSKKVQLLIEQAKINNFKQFP